MKVERIFSGKYSIIDVRTSEEFSQGQAPGSVNIPLGEIVERLNEIKTLPRPLILCCASGTRSERAEQWLKSQGVAEVYNGGSWLDVSHYVIQNK
ncbi:MAG: rhodanese-like domain-containing protein [Crocinitomicaceae bacterium]|nr:rhodanese-like domain-containing protein [Crocinitomicaceae bacterium]